MPMEYNIAAAKLMCRQLKAAEQTTSESTQSTVYAFGGILFQRVWVQGVIVKSYPDDDSRVLLDDGSAVIELFLTPGFRKQLDPGQYVMVVGAYDFREDEPMIKVHKLVDLSTYPDREAMWYLEVIEASKMFYQPLLEDTRTQNFG